MHALLFGVAPRNGDDHDRQPVAGRARAHPDGLVEMPDPGFLLPDWVVTSPRLTGICGSDSKQVFMDWGEVRRATTR